MQSKTPGNEEKISETENVEADVNTFSVESSEKLDTESEATTASAENFEVKLNEINSKYLYAMAELDNTRKRHIKERSELLKYSGESLARDLLEVLDDLERAASQPIESESAQVLEGVNLIANRMRTLFERFGIKAEDSNGQMFDPKKHEALTVAPSSQGDAGKILQQITKCYYFKDKLLRPGQVIVGSGEGLEAEPTENKPE